MEVEVIKRKGIDHLVSGYSPRKVEDEREAEAVGGNDFTLLLQKYKKYLDNGYHPQSLFDFLNRLHYVDEMLTSSGINAFLQTVTIIYQDYGSDYNRHTGKFISKLIQNSFNAGYNKFSLSMPTPSFSSVASFLKGRKNEPIELCIQGKVGGNCGRFTEYVNLTVDGDASHLFASQSENCCFTVKGDVGSSCGGSSWLSTFDIHGSVRQCLAAKASHSQFIIHGDVGEDSGTGAGNCVFRSPNKRTVRKLLQNLSLGGNELYLINKNGKEKKYL